MTFRPLLLAAALAAAAAPAAVVQAQASDPGAQTISAFDDALLDVMKSAKGGLGVEGRYRKLEPAIAAAFDLPTMTRFAVGPTWTSLSPADQASLIKAFTRLTVANYAKNFDDWDGQRFTIDAQVQTRGPDKLVHTHIVSAKNKPVDLTYRMRVAADGRWKIIDVYYNGSVSELTARRSDFGASISQGPQALLAKINALSDKLLRG
jgi:phospholipid transport system substrate-binding protein